MRERASEQQRSDPPGSDAGGQGLVEYGLILSLIAIVALIALIFFGDAIASMLQLIADEIDKAS